MMNSQFILLQKRFIRPIQQHRISYYQYRALTSQMLPLQKYSCNMGTYIKSLRSLLQKGQCKDFVLGNSGADYDSVVGAIIFAFYLTNSQKKLHLPLIDCPQSDLPMRFQQIKVFESFNIDYQQLLYTEMIPNLYNSGFNFSLHDHNTRLTIQPDHLVNIVDHHAYDPEVIKCNHIINHVGSGLTLLYYLYYPQLLQKFKDSQLYKKFIVFLKHHKKLDKIQDQELINHLIYYGITIDTYGININQAQVWNQFDEYAVQTLQSKIKPKFNFLDLGSAKYNTQNNLKLSFKQQQKKDYKYLKYQTFYAHYSTILFDIDQFLNKYGAQLKQSLVPQKMKQNQAYVFMFSFPRQSEDIIVGNFRKFILFNAKQQKLIDKIQVVMRQMNFTKLQDYGGWRKWVDLSGRISRKILDKQLKSNQQQLQIDPLKDL